MLKHLAGVSMIALSTPALAASSDAVYELTVIIDTVQTPALCDLEHNICINGQPPAFTEGPVPYRFATLKITHDALTKHNARLSDMTNPPTDDGRITSFTLASLPGIDGGSSRLSDHTGSRSLLPSWIPGSAFRKHSALQLYQSSANRR